MRMFVIALTALCGGFVLGAYVSERVVVRPGRVEVLTVRDTVAITSPPKVVVRYLHADTVWLAAAGTAGDTVRTIVPVEQAIYSGDGYQAYVSGYRPRLDSLIMVRAVTSVAASGRAPRSPKFSIGLQAGYGITPRGPQPYIGVGLSYSIQF